MDNLDSTQLNNVVVTGFDGDYIFDSIRKTKDFYEVNLLREWLPYLKESRVILDIGANLGNHTLFWATHMPDASIVSFEPLPANYGLLKLNIENNKLSNVMAVNKGIGDREGLFSIKNFDEANYGATSLSENPSEEGTISITTVDSFCSTHHFGSVDFVKIDTEGYELHVLEGMQGTLAKDLPDLWIEVSRSSCMEVIRILKSLDYVLVDISGFNLLFLNLNRHSALRQVPIEKVLDAALYNLERTNHYYRDYTIAKGWVEGKNAVLEKTRDLLIKTKKKLTDTQSKLSTTQIAYCNKLMSVQASLNKTERKLMLTEAQKKELQRQLAGISEKYENLFLKHREETQRVRKRLIEYYFTFQRTALMAQQLVREIKEIKKRNQVLLQQNQVLQSKVDKVTNNFIGRIGVGAYRLYHKAGRYIDRIRDVGYVKLDRKP